MEETQDYEIRKLEERVSRLEENLKDLTESVNKLIDTYKKMACFLAEHLRDSTFDLF